MKSAQARTIVLLTLPPASTLSVQSNEAVSDGNLDTSFSEDGMVTVGFDVGGSDEDVARAIASDTLGCRVVRRVVKRGNGHAIS